MACSMLVLCLMCLGFAVAVEENSAGRTDCNISGIDDWTEVQRVWCCEHKDVGCQFDCKAGYHNWEAGWSEAKKEWCCENRRRGCHAFKTASQPYDCQKNYYDRADWPQEQKDWCCRNKQLGCFLPTTTQAKPTKTSTVTTTLEINTTTSQTTTELTTSETTMARVTNASNQTTTESTAVVTTAAPTTAHTSTLAVTTATATSSSSSTSKAPAASQQEEEEEGRSCFEDQITWEPLDMPGTAPRHAEDTTACQEMCANTSGCVHFSYWWIGKHCHLQDAYALRQTGRLGFISGPFGCWDKIDQSQYMRKGDNTFVRKSYKCVELGTLYTPIMGLAKHLPESNGSSVEVIKACRSYCASTEGCAFYTVVFPHRFCRLAGTGAHEVKPYMGAVSGTPTCWGGEEHDHPLQAEDLAPAAVSTTKSLVVDDGELHVVMKASLRAGVPDAQQSVRGLGVFLAVFAVVGVALGVVVSARRARMPGSSYMSMRRQAAGAATAVE